MNKQFETKVLKISYDNFESAIISFLYSVDAIPETADVIATDFGIPVDADGMVTFDVTYTKAPMLRLV